MTENQKNSVKKSFWQRNLFLLIVLLLMALGGGGYLYQQNILTFQTPQQLNNSEEIVSELAKTQPILDNNQELQDKVDRLENLILQLNKNVQNIQNQYLFFQDQKFEELLTLPDYTYLIQQINQSEQKYIQEEFMKNDNFSWFKKIIENIFEINIAKNSTYPISGYLNALMNRQYDLALMEYEKLSPNQKIFFKSSFELAQAYDQQKVFLENMI